MCSPVAATINPVAGRASGPMTAVERRTARLCSMRLEVRLALVLVATAGALLGVMMLLGGIDGYALWMTAGASLLTTLVYLEKRVDDRGRPKDK
jgi:hypothetical protein